MQLCTLPDISAPDILPGKLLQHNHCRSVVGTNTTHPRCYNAASGRLYLLAGLLRGGHPQFESPPSAAAIEFLDISGVVYQPVLSVAAPQDALHQVVLVFVPAQPLLS